MTLSAGTRLGPYEILSPLGTGGMGEVYRARDARLHRTVAIKVLPAHLSFSPELRQRFEREAKAISQISHPHICAVYDVNREGETEYLVMEYLEGESLAARLGKGPLPIQQVLRYGIEIAEALDSAPESLEDVVMGNRLAEHGAKSSIRPGPRQKARPPFSRDLVSRKTNFANKGCKDYSQRKPPIGPTTRNLFQATSVCG